MLRTTMCEKATHTTPAPTRTLTLQRVLSQIKPARVLSFYSKSNQLRWVHFIHPTVLHRTLLVRMQLSRARMASAEAHMFEIDGGDSMETVPSIFIGMIVCGLVICLAVHCAAGEKVRQESTQNFPIQPASQSLPQARCDGLEDIQHTAKNSPQLHHEKQS